MDSPAETLRKQVFVDSVIQKISDQHQIPLEKFYPRLFNTRAVIRVELHGNVNIGELAKSVPGRVEQQETVQGVKETWIYLDLGSNRLLQKLCAVTPIVSFCFVLIGFAGLVSQPANSRMLW